MSGKDNTANFDDSLRTNHLAVCCDVGQQLLERQDCYTRIKCMKIIK